MKKKAWIDFFIIITKDFLASLSKRAKLPKQYPSGYCIKGIYTTHPACVASKPDMRRSCILASMPAMQTVKRQVYLCNTAS